MRLHIFAGLFVFAVFVHGCGGSTAQSNPIDPNLSVLAKNVVYSPDNTITNVTSNNVEDAITDTNSDANKIIVGNWNVRHFSTGATGNVTFNADGTYTITNGKFEAGGSWLGDNVTTGRYVAQDDLIGFSYDGAPIAGQMYNRISLILYKRHNKLSISTLGHTHGVEILEKQ